MSIPYIDLCVGCSITVLVIESGGKHLFISQPYTPHLVELMAAMRVYYEPLQVTPVSISSELAAGDVCCVQHGYDKCWYRAKILNISRDMSGSPHTFSEDSYLVLFVDYGIIERVFGFEIFVLPKEFCELPCQALNISILASPAVCDYRNSPYELVGSIVCLFINLPYDCNSFVGTIQSENVERRIIAVDSTLLPLRLRLPQIEFPFKAVVAHVNTVRDFYIHKLDTITAERMKQFESFMQKYYSDEVNHTRSGSKAGAVVCVYSFVCELFCRAIVLEENNNECFVQLVDYGHSEKISVQCILELHPDFLLFPVFSIHCSLMVLENELEIEVYTKLFQELLASMEVLTVVKVITSERVIYPLAEDPTKHWASSYQSKVSHWDPMEVDYLSSQNKYDDLNQDSKSTVQCFFGSSILKYSSSQLLLPEIGDILVIVITSIYSPQRFFVQMPLGISAIEMETETCPASKLDDLLKDMNEYYSSQVFEEDFDFVADGEVVAAYKDDYWFRANIMKCKRENVMVFTVDFGDIFVLSSSCIRILKEQFLTLPFQAVECFIPKSGYHASSDRDFIGHVRDNAMLAEVVGKYNQCLYLQLQTHDIGGKPIYWDLPHQNTSSEY